jgi:hypothetical protein
MDLLGHGWLEKTNCYAASLRAGRLLGWRGIEGEFALYNPPTQSPTPPRGVFPERPPPLPSNTWFFDITQQRRGSRSLVGRKRRNERREYIEEGTGWLPLSYHARMTWLSGVDGISKIWSSSRLHYTRRNSASLYSRQMPYTNNNRDSTLSSARQWKWI